MKTEAESEVMQLKQAWSHQKLEGKLWRECSPEDNLSLDFFAQNCEKIHFCCLSQKENETHISVNLRYQELINISQILSSYSRS